MLYDDNDEESLEGLYKEFTGSKADSERKRNIEAVRAQERGRIAFLKLSNDSKPNSSEECRNLKTHKNMENCQNRNVSNEPCTSSGENIVFIPSIMNSYWSDQNITPQCPSETSSDDRSEYYMDVFSDTEQKNIKSLKDVEQRKKMQEQTLARASSRYEEALRKKRIIDQYHETMEQLRDAQRQYYKNKAHETNLIPQNRTTMCPAVDKTMQRQYQGKINAQVEKTCPKISKEHAIEDLEGYEDDFEKRFPPKLDSEEQIMKEDSGVGGSLMKTDSFVDLYFKGRTRLSDDDVFNTAYLETSPDVDHSNKSGVKYSSKPAVSSPKRLEKRNIGIQVRPNNLSRGTQAHVFTRSESSEELTLKAKRSVDAQTATDPVHMITPDTTILETEDVKFNTVFCRKPLLPSLFSYHDDDNQESAHPYDPKVSKPSFPPLTSSTFPLLKTTKNDDEIRKAVPLSEPIRQRPTSLTSEEIVKALHQEFLIEESMKDLVFSPSSDTYSTPLLHFSPEETVQPAPVDISKDRCDSLRASELLKEALKQNSVNNPPSPVSHWAYHDLSTIQEMDSALTNSPGTSLVDAMKESFQLDDNIAMVSSKYRSIDMGTQYDDAQIKDVTRCSMGNILLDAANASTSDSDSFKLLTPLTRSSISDKKSSSSGSTSSLFQPLSLLTGTSDSHVSYLSRKGEDSGESFKPMYQVRSSTESLTTSGINKEPMHLFDENQSNEEDSIILQFQPLSEIVENMISINKQSDGEFSSSAALGTSRRPVQPFDKDSSNLQFQQLSAVPNTPSSTSDTSLKMIPMQSLPKNRSIDEDSIILQFQPLSEIIPNTPSSISTTISKPSPVYPFTTSRHRLIGQSDSSCDFQPLTLISKTEDSTSLSFQPLSLLPDESSAKSPSANERYFVPLSVKSGDDDGSIGKPVLLVPGSSESSSRSSREHTPIAFRDKMFSKVLQAGSSNSSSEENMSQMFTRSKQFFQSTPVKDIESANKVKQEDVLMNEPELSFKEITISDTSANNVAAEEEMETKRKKKTEELDTMMSQSMMSFLEHEKSAMEADDNGEGS